jgi:hypothetical protein
MYMYGKYSKVFIVSVTAKRICVNTNEGMWGVLQQSSLYKDFTPLWSKFLATDPEVRIRFPALPDFLRSSGSGTGSTQPCEYN